MNSENIENPEALKDTTSLQDSRSLEKEEGIDLIAKEREVIEKSRHTPDPWKQYEQTFTKHIKYVKTYKGDSL